MGTDTPDPDALSAQVARLTQRVFALEQALARGAAPASPRLAAEALSRTAPAAPPPRWVPEPIAEVAAAAPALQRDQDSLEARIGTRWFSYLGILAVVLGLAILLKLAIDNDWIGLAERVFAGVVLGVALVGAGERVLRRGYAVSGYALATVGTGAVYLSLWAGYILYGLIPGAAAFAGMAAVTAYNGLNCWSKDNQIYAALALVGAFLMPVLLANGHNHEMALFVFLLMLDAAIGALAAAKPWRWLLPAALAGTVLLGTGWSVRYYDINAWGITDGFIAAFIVLFSVAVRSARNLRLAEAAVVAPEEIAVGIPVVLAGLGWLALRVTLGPGSLEPWEWRQTALLAAWSFGLFCWQAVDAPDLPAGQQLWRWTHLALAIALGTLAATLKLSGRPLTLEWLAEGVGLVALAVFYRNLTFLRVFAMGLLLAGTLATLFNNDYGGARVVFNPRFGLYLAAIAALGAAVTLAGRRTSGQTEEQDLAWSALGWPTLEVMLGAAVCVLPLMAGGFEIFTWWWGASQGTYLGAAQQSRLDFGSQLSYSLWGMLYGAGLLAIGFWRLWERLRWLALGLVSLAIGKVLLYDVDTLGLAYRVVSLFVLGALLLGISYAYQRPRRSRGRPGTSE